MEARAAGKIGHTGLTAHSPEVFERALELDWVETVMFPYNIVETQAAELMERARKRDVGFINLAQSASPYRLRYPWNTKLLGISIPTVQGAQYWKIRPVPPGTA